MIISLLSKGRSGDAKVFSSTVIARKMITDPERWFPDNTYLIGGMYKDELKGLHKLLFLIFTFQNRHSLPFA